MSPQQQPPQDGQLSQRPGPSDEEPKPKRTGRKILLGVIGVFVLIFAITALASCEDESTPAAETPATEPEPEAEPAEDEAEDDEAEAADESAEEVAEPEPEPAAEPVTYEGSGDAVVDIEKLGSLTIGIAEITHTGEQNFIVSTDDDLLVNEIGNYSGTVAFDVWDQQDSDRLQIQADGSWTVTLLPAESIETFDTVIEGTGDSVVEFSGDEEVLSLEHSGEQNFIVQAHGTGLGDLMVNEIGSYSGEQLIGGTALISIKADGDWSIAVR